MASIWSPLKTQPAFNASTMLLLTDASVLCADEGSAAIGTPRWWKLTPDRTGDYTNGTWSRVADGPNSPLYFASAVLADGRVFVAGGEYNGSATSTDLLAAEIYDPLTDKWTSIETPSGWTAIGDAPCCVLPNGYVMIGNINDGRTAIYDPAAKTWTASATKLNGKCDEESWVLLPDGTILAEDCFGHPATEKYIIAQNQWISTGSTPSDLVESTSEEIGPAILLNDGRVWVIGATGHTALYTPGTTPSEVGTWSATSDVPTSNGKTLGAKDAPACLLPNGKVLLAVGPVDGNKDTYSPPTFFFEFDPQLNTYTLVTAPPNSGAPPFAGRLLVVPSGQVLFANGSNDIEVYTPDGQPYAAWAPKITKCPAALTPGGTYTLEGLQLNGMSQCCGYGDDVSMATNYPLVRMQNLQTSNIYYCRTSNHSSMSVQTGTIPVSTQFTVPADTEIGNFQLFVVANGISSSAFPVSVQASSGQGTVPLGFDTTKDPIGGPEHNAAPTDDTLNYSEAPPYFTDALEDAERLLKYAAETGINVDSSVRASILEARRAVSAGWNEKTISDLLAALTNLAAQLRPVTAESLENFKTKPTVRSYWIVAICLAVFIIPFSVASFVTSAISKNISADIIAANDLAVKLSVQFGVFGSQVSTSNAAANAAKAASSLPAGLSPTDALTELQTFAALMREIYARSRQLNWLTLHATADPFSNLRAAGQFKSTFELPVPLPLDLGPIVAGRIQVYQDVRSFATDVVDDVSVFYGAISSSILPVLYALLGTCAYLLRCFSQEMSSRTFVPSHSNSARFLIAGIVGGVVGLFNNFTISSGASIPPLAIAFVVGYAVDVFFSFLEGLIQVFTKSKDGANVSLAATKT
jgi:hypothetical protein